MARNNAAAVVIVIVVVVAVVVAVVWGLLVLWYWDCCDSPQSHSPRLNLDLCVCVSVRACPRVWSDLVARRAVESFVSEDGETVNFSFSEVSVCVQCTCPALCVPATWKRGGVHATPRGHTSSWPWLLLSLFEWLGGRAWW
jgi:hypothetical protein